MMGKQQQIFIQDWLQLLLPTGRDKEEVSMLLEQTHHVSVAQAKQREQPKPQQTRQQVFSLISATILLQELNYSLQTSCSLLKWK